MNVRYDKAKYAELDARMQEAKERAGLGGTPMEPVDVIVEDLEVDMSQADDLGRYEVEIHGIKRQVALHRSARGLEGKQTLDVVLFEAPKEIKVTDRDTKEVKTIPKGYPVRKLTPAAWFAVPEPVPAPAPPPAPTRTTRGTRAS